MSPASSLESPPTRGPYSTPYPASSLPRPTFSKAAQNPLTALYHFQSYLPQETPTVHNVTFRLQTPSSRADGSMTTSPWASLLKPSWEQMAIGQKQIIWARWLMEDDTSFYPQNRHPQRFFNIKAHLELTVLPIHPYILEIPHCPAHPCPQTKTHTHTHRGVSRETLIWFDC